MQNTCLIANYYHPTKFEFCYWDKDFQTLIKAAARHEVIMTQKFKENVVSKFKIRL